MNDIVGYVKGLPKGTRAWSEHRLDYLIGRLHFVSPEDLQAELEIVFEVYGIQHERQCLPSRGSQRS